MRDVPEPLGRALGTRAAQGRAVLVPHDRRAALRADIRHHEGHGPVGALVLVDGQDLRDDLPRLLKQHCVADAKIQSVDVVLIVKRRR